ncbi:MAG: Ig-like domain-containing protein [Candidatus Manganitrophus sp.]|nr:Ig-like domain-containing protein [Candidatus Manganitrophus sp.]
MMPTSNGRCWSSPEDRSAYNTSYTAVLGAGIRSTSGTPMGSDYVWTFTTEAAPDTTPLRWPGAIPPMALRLFR